MCLNTALGTVCTGLLNCIGYCVDSQCPEMVMSLGFEKTPLCAEICKQDSRTPHSHYTCTAMTNAIVTHPTANSSGNRKVCLACKKCMAFMTHMYTQTH